MCVRQETYYSVNLFSGLQISTTSGLIFTFGLRFLAIYKKLQMPAILSTKQGVSN